MKWWALFTPLWWMQRCSSKRVDSTGPRGSPQTCSGYFSNSAVNRWRVLYPMDHSKHKLVHCKAILTFLTLWNIWAAMIESLPISQQRQSRISNSGCYNRGRFKLSLDSALPVFPHCPGWSPDVVYSFEASGALWRAWSKHLGSRPMPTSVVSCI